MMQSITLDLPQQIYEQIERAAERVQRPVKEILIEAISAVAPIANSASIDLKASFAQMALWNDAALWRAACTTMPLEQKQQLESLHHKQQREGLTESEKKEEQTLLKLYQDTILIRAQAAVLLKQRKYDISNPALFYPLN